MAAIREQTNEGRAGRIGAERGVGHVMATVGCRAGRGSTGDWERAARIVGSVNAASAGNAGVVSAGDRVLRRSEIRGGRMKGWEENEGRKTGERGTGERGERGVTSQVG